MKKATYLFLLLASIAFYMGCSKGTQTPGPTGPAGPAGSPGGGFEGTINTYDGLILNANSFNNGSGSSKYFLYQTITNPSLTYMLSVYISNITNPKVWNKLPVQNYFQFGDEIYATLSYDSVKVFYKGTFPIDSAASCNIIIVPQQ